MAINKVLGVGSPGEQNLRSGMRAYSALSESSISATGVELQQTNENIYHHVFIDTYYKSSGKRVREIANPNKLVI